MNGSRKISFTVLSMISIENTKFMGAADESRQGQMVCVDGGRLKRCGKSKRSEAPPDGHRSDSSGIVDQFPTQRSSDFGLDALRLSRPPALRSVKIFFTSFQMPAIHAYHLPLAAFWL